VPEEAAQHASNIRYFPWRRKSLLNAELVTKLAQPKRAICKLRTNQNNATFLRRHASGNISFVIYSWKSTFIALLYGSGFQHFCSRTPRCNFFSTSHPQSCWCAHGDTRRHLRGYVKTVYINRNETRQPPEPWTSSDPRTHEDSSPNWEAGMPETNSVI
jgi:hypothetical protein